MVDQTIPGFRVDGQAAELLAVLRKAHKWILQDDADRFGPAETAQWNKLLDEIEAAIAKASPIPYTLEGGHD